MVVILILNRVLVQNHHDHYVKLMVTPQGSQGRGVEAADARPGSGQTDQSAVDPGDGGAVGGAVLQGGGPVRATQVNSTA